MARDNQDKPTRRFGLYADWLDHVNPRGVTALLASLSQLVEGIFRIGYPGIVIALIIEGLGLPFPGDAVMAFYGFAAAKGNFRLDGVIVCSLIGYLFGCTIAYLVSRRIGRDAIDRLANLRWFNSRSLLRTSRLIDRYGPLLLIPGRFLPGVRSVSPYVAGIAGMELEPFLIYTGIGAALWCSAWVCVGFWFGEHLDWILHVAQSSLAYLTGAVLVIGIAYWLWRRRTTT
ncbi:DedA family protein [Alicyclobacillus herbarius]|uniref:DedA family protein n=1 Tax=Alicyclobacillus herbarius TaxID=122960 RepID=UPI0009D69986|nr:DedA family protein [Alicyclobacillus herbarius]